MSAVESVAMAKLIEILSSEVGKKLGKIKDVISLFRFAPSKFNRTILKRASTTNTKWNDTPDLTFVNPLNRDVTIREYSLVGDAVFMTMGSVRIKIDNDLIYESDEAGNFTDLTEGSQVKITEGKILKRDEKINVFLKTNATVINLAVQVSLGD